jgi:hypothetical protein
MSATLATSHAVGILLECVVCEGANLDNSRIRNLLWDQEVAASVGQSMDCLPMLLITRDGFFREAAVRAGHHTAVYPPAEYAAMLGVTLMAEH